MEHREIKTPEQIAELKLRSPGGYRNLRETVINELPDASLLPTPAVGHIRNHDEPIENYLQRRQDFVDGRTKGMPDASLGVAVRMEMMPTPKALDGVKGNLKTSQERLDSGHQVDLPNVAIDLVPETNWGKFEPAIRRWESLTRPAPSPTKPDGKDGNHRLSAEFTEWMMGLPAGWVTAEDLGLKRNDQLKACGNGVVPQQAELALRMLLEGLPLATTIRGGLEHVLPTPTVMDQRDGKHFRTVAVKNLEIGKNRGLNLNNVVEAVGVDWQDGDTFIMTEDGLKKNDN